MDTQKKGIGKGELIALIVSSCIGTGIFGITSDVAAAAAPGPALLAWLFVAFGFLAGPTGCQLGWVTLPLLRC